MYLHHELMCGWRSVFCSVEKGALTSTITVHLFGSILDFSIAEDVRSSKYRTVKFTKASCKVPHKHVRIKGDSLNLRHNLQRVWTFKKAKSVVLKKERDFNWMQFSSPERADMVLFGEKFTLGVDGKMCQNKYVPAVVMSKSVDLQMGRVVFEIVPYDKAERWRFSWWANKINPVLFHAIDFTARKFIYGIEHHVGANMRGDDYRESVADLYYNSLLNRELNSCADLPVKEIA